MLFRKIALAAAGILMAAGIAAGADDNRGTIGEILSAKRVVLMNDLSSAPWQFRDANGNAAGFSIDLDRMIAARLGVDLHLINTEWAGLIPGLLSRKTDFVASSMSTTFKRAQQVLFTNGTWYKTGVVAIVKPDVGVTSWEDLNKPDRTIAIKAGTSGVDVAKQFFPDAKIQSYPSDIDLYQVLKGGRVDAALNDLAALNAIKDSYGFDTLKEPRELISTDTWAFAVRPGDVYTWQYLDFFLTKIHESGELDALYKYWVTGEQWQADFMKKNDGVSQQRKDLVNLLGIQDYTAETGGTRMTLE
ncbi:ABC transporter substrate-binding protein [Shinella sp. NM-101]|uniref:substrate-binding periplasmic protein n=1 Tax=Shinella sp. NM-101 TaxID=2744455 RepID=UPI001F2E298E|nr:transporter substrate-binding domain-containing protein [Shinella sp. NM-101]